MIVWQDMPNGGGDYNMVFVTYLTNAFDWFARGVRDNLYGMFKRQDKEGRAQYYRDLEAMIEQLYNHPSIAVWVPFNEGWGQLMRDVQLHLFEVLIRQDLLMKPVDGSTSRAVICTVSTITNRVLL